MLTLLFGSVFSVAILIFTFLHSKAGLTTFVNPEGIMIVAGGTVAILLMTSKYDDLANFFRLLRSMLLKRGNSEQLAKTLLEVSSSIERGKIPTETPHPFLTKALGWLAAGLKGKELDKLLVDGAKLEIERIHRSAQVLSNVVKYPPALGMIGTVFGIIAIFHGLGNVEGQKNIGVNLAFAMTATLYGLVTANFVISPLSELFMQSAEHEELELGMIVETIKLWSEKESSFFVKEHIELYAA
ncbi:MAG: MotA/TolQ/ExbB proton channel family protein [Deltaproteobacteria bacterium]|nr:MotA/TolQ/ExbB proton channel family protein [Deltaproteobacteria bacterium]